MKKTLFKLIPAIFYTLLVVFLLLYLRTIDFTKVLNINFNWWWLVVASVLALAFRYWGAYIWIVILRSLGALNIHLSRALIYIYAKSWLGRYIPGAAPWILGKIYFASQQGISKNKLAVSSMLEAGLQIIVQLLFAFSLLVFDPRLDIIPSNLKVLIVIAILGCLVALIPKVFNTFLSLAYKVVKRKPFSKEHYATNKTIASGFGLYIVGSIMSSLSLFFIAKAVYPTLGFDEIFFVMGVSTLAGAVSMLAVFAPAGIGVREGIQLTLLSVIMPTEIALVITVATRLWSVVTDLLFFAISRLFRRSTT